MVIVSTKKGSLPLTTASMGVEFNSACSCFFVGFGRVVEAYNMLSQISNSMSAFDDLICLKDMGCIGAFPVLGRLCNSSWVLTTTPY